MKKILVVDTNFLLVPYQFRIDIFSEIEKLVEGGYVLIVPTVVKKEVDKIANSKGRHALGARLALKLLKVNEKLVEFTPSSGYADDWILNFAMEKRAIVCTNDKKLRSLSKKQDLRVITMKSKAKIGMV